MREESERIRSERGHARFAKGYFAEATRLFDELVASEQLEEFLTLKAYELLDGEAESEEPSTAVIPMKRPKDFSAVNGQKSLLTLTQTAVP